MKVEVFLKAALREASITHYALRIPNYCGVLMENANLTNFDAILNYVLLMTGMATISGVGAKLLVPGQKLQGVVTTFLLGLVSTILSGLILKYLYRVWWDVTDFNLFQIFTLVLSIALGAVMLFLYRWIMDLFSH